jgi:hypothetical protein
VDVNGWWSGNENPANGYTTYDWEPDDTALNIRYGLIVTPRIGDPVNLVFPNGTHRFATGTVQAFYDKQLTAWTSTSSVGFGSADILGFHPQVQSGQITNGETSLYSMSLRCVRSID